MNAAERLSRCAARTVRGAGLAEMFDRIALFQPWADEDMGGRRRGEKQMTGGPDRRRPESDDEAEIEGMKTKAGRGKHAGADERTPVRRSHPAICRGAAASGKRLARGPEGQIRGTRAQSHARPARPWLDLGGNGRRNRPVGVQPGLQEKSGDGAGDVSKSAPKREALPPAGPISCGSFGDGPRARNAMGHAPLSPRAEHSY